MPNGTIVAGGYTFRSNDINGDGSVHAGGQTLFDASGAAFAPTNPVPVGGAYPVAVTATIANAASLSGAVDLGRSSLSAIIMPAAWTAASLTFQVSHDNTTYVDLYDAGVERSLSVTTSRGYALSVQDWAAFRYIKLRSGTSGTPVTQGASRAIILLGVA